MDWEFDLKLGTWCSTTVPENLIKLLKEGSYNRHATPTQGLGMGRLNSRWAGGQAGLQGTRRT